MSGSINWVGQTLNWVGQCSTEPFVVSLLVTALLYQLLKICASNNDVSNYRLITIEAIFTKLFEQSMMPLLDPFMHFHDNQFGYVAGGGYSKVLFALKSTV